MFLFSFVKLIFYINPKRLEIHLMSQKNREKNEIAKLNRLNESGSLRIFSDADSFRKRMNLYPDLYSHL